MLSTLTEENAVEKDDYDHTKHPFYIFGAGVVIGVIGTFSVLMFFYEKSYVHRDEINKYLKDIGKIVVEETEYNRLLLAEESLIRKDEINEYLKNKGKIVVELTEHNKLKLYKENNDKQVKDENFIRKDQIYNYIESQGKIITDKEEYNRQILSAYKNNENQEIFEEPENDNFVRVKITKKSPHASLEKFDKNLSVEIAKFYKIRNQVRVKIYNKKSGKGKYFYLTFQNSAEWDFNNNKYKFSLLEIYDDEGALIGVTQY